MRAVLPLFAFLAVGTTIGGKVSPQGAEIQIDLPDSQHLHNTGGSDGAGLCVFTSIEHSARWQNVEALQGFQQWMRKYPGGGWPEKLDAKIREYAKGDVPKFAQVQGRSEQLLPLIETALKSGRAVACTYCWSPSGRYNGRKIAHMVNVVHLDAKSACVLDNNYPGTKQYEWMTREEFSRSLGSPGWIAVLLDAGPPPLPWNRKE